MSQPLPMTPLPYYGPPPFLTHPKLPPGPKALVIIAIVLGGLGVVSLCALPMYFVNLGFRNGPFDAIRNDPTLLRLTIGTAIVHSAVSVFLLVSSIRALTLKPSGRPMLVVASALMLLLNIASPIMNFALTLPAYRRLAAQHPNDPVLQSMARHGPIGLIFGVVWIVYYMLVLRVFTGAKIKEMFAEANSAVPPLNRPSP